MVEWRRSAMGAHHDCPLLLMIPQTELALGGSNGVAKEGAMIPFWPWSQLPCSKHLCNLQYKVTLTFKNTWLSQAIWEPFGKK